MTSEDNVGELTPDELDQMKRRAIALHEPMSLVVTPKNVECPRCCGEGTVLETRPLANNNYRPCPLCTPENVEEPNAVHT